MGNIGFLGRKDWLFWGVRCLGKVLLSPFFRIDTQGEENLPRNSPFVLLPKHQRWEDIPILGIATPNPLYYVAKYELFTNPLGSWFLKSLGGIPLNRNRPLESRRSIRAMIEFLREGEGVVVFPEGTYYRGRMGPGHVGMIRLILSRLTLPFIPLGINYSKKGFRTFVRLRFGKPFHADPTAYPNSFLEQMMRQIAELSALAQGPTQASGR
ncbi:MAG: 1-acyl-sn-glycerol-3-phosphate acyltransferase [Desulfobacteraceae bacterium]|nr:1-acyl-sn-glycerol-3-phosphate acyltransferase [Desulfobacteraceae bacterium]